MTLSKGAGIFHSVLLLRDIAAFMVQECMPDDVPEREVHCSCLCYRSVEHYCVCSTPRHTPLWWQFHCTTIPSKVPTHVLQLQVTSFDSLGTARAVLKQMCSMLCSKLLLLSLHVGSDIFGTIGFSDLGNPWKPRLRKSTSRPGNRAS